MYRGLFLAKVLTFLPHKLSHLYLCYFLYFFL